MMTTDWSISLIVTPADCETEHAFCRSNAGFGCFLDEIWRDIGNTTAAQLTRPKRVHPRGQPTPVREAMCQSSVTAGGKAAQLRGAPRDGPGHVGRRSTRRGSRGTRIRPIAAPRPR